MRIQANPPPTPLPPQEIGKFQIWGKSLLVFGFMSQFPIGIVMTLKMMVTYAWVLSQYILILKHSCFEVIMTERIDALGYKVSETIILFFQDGSPFTPLVRPQGLFSTVHLREPLVFVIVLRYFIRFSCFRRPAITSTGFCTGNQQFWFVFSPLICYSVKYSCTVLFVSFYQLPFFFFK